MSRCIVVDANIIIRAVLGQRVTKLLDIYNEKIVFLTCDQALREARKHLPNILRHRTAADDTIAAALTKLETLIPYFTVIETQHLGTVEDEARRRIQHRDENDWAYVALALMFDCPIWTEDRDFFGCGVATWTSSTVEIFLNLS